MSITKLGFVGLGLIGGSIAKTAKRIHPDLKIIALSGHQSTIDAAFQEGLIENQKNASIEDFSDCDYIFLCTPVQQNQGYLKQLKEIINPDCIITDVGSVKGDIHREILAMGMEHCFIGGHPMTGSEKTGLKNATAYLLENAYYIITPTPSVSRERIEEFSQFVSSLGAIPLVLDYNLHDKATAAISHLPHVIAYALVNLVKDSDSRDEVMKRIAAGGFKDITRIASSSPVMWEEICISNKEMLLSMIDTFGQYLSDIRQKIADCDAKSIRGFFQDAKDYRDSLAVSPKNTVQTVFELYCDLIDEAGGIATISTILATHNLSIKNIGIIHNREFEDGVLKIEMYDQPSYINAIELLRNYQYTVYER
ncbi:MAG: prephenate dehydrogenase [Roseburia sp.]|nr:prephenate dehydrogenase [Roseburia sp.]